MSDVRELIKRAVAQLTSAGCPSPETDAQLLLAFVLDLDRTELSLVTEISPSQLAEFDALVAKRASRIPLQHLTGQAFFRHLTLQVGPGVFIPRPETELLVQAGLDELAKQTSPKLAVDLCSGSGAIALSLALESPNTTVHAVEYSLDAFIWLEKNVAAYTQQLDRINSSVITYNDDAQSRELLAQLNGTVDLVLSNPPYIPDAMIPREPEVRDHDPDLALYGGEDGLVVAQNVALVAADLLKPQGFFGMEHADVQGQSAVAMLTEMKNSDQPLWVNEIDNNQLPRFVTASRTSVSSVGAK
jgi:release factor glutamine methyltransferase